MTIGEKFFKDSGSLESAFNESMFALRRQDNILSEINRIGFEVSQGRAEALMPYLAALERFYMELSVIYSNDWEEENVELKDGKKGIKLSRPEQLKYVENRISKLSVQIDRVLQGTATKEDTTVPELKSLELYLRRLKQLHGMGVKREEQVDDEQRLTEAFGV